MLEFLETNDELTLAIKVGGELTLTDYEERLIPRMEDLFKLFLRVRLLVVFEDDFAGWETPAAAWDDLKLGLRHSGDFERLALVGPPGWVTWGCYFFGLFLKGEIRIFQRNERNSAMNWLVQGDVSKNFPQHKPEK